MPNKRIFVLGAGLAGLSAAWHLQKSGVLCSVFEKESEVGGLCRSKTINGFTFDYAGHLLHFRHRYAFDLVKTLLKDNLAVHKRNAWVYFDGLLIAYPFQANLRELPRDIAQKCLADFICAHNKGFRRKTDNFLHWIKEHFGAGIAKHFMIPYNTKFWTVPPQNMICDWVEGFIPRPTLVQLLVGTVGGKKEQLGYNINFWYPRKGGIAQLPLAFRNQISNVHTDYEISKIDLKKKEFSFSNGSKIGFDHLISTIPLPALAKIIQEVPSDVDKAFKKLRWNSIFNLNLGLRQEDRSARHWIYFPHKEVSFFRTGFFHNFSFNMVPSGCGAVYVEVAYSQRKSVDKNRLVEFIKQDLRKTGLMNISDKIMAMGINDITYGYPIYDKNYLAARRCILRFLSKYNITLCGRYGSWRYMSMEDVIMDGKEVAQQFI